MTAPFDPAVPRALARSPFALLAWVLTALGPAQLLGPNSRALVLRALLDFGRGVRLVLHEKAAHAERATIEGLERRNREAITALGEDYRALTDEALPEPTIAIDGPIVMRVILAFAYELDQRGIEGAALLPATFDKVLCDRLAIRASAVELPSHDKNEKGKKRRR